MQQCFLIETATGSGTYTLESAETQVCQAEAVELQQQLLRVGYIGGKLGCTVNKGSNTLTIIIVVYIRNRRGTNKL